ncbi:Site-specific recombinase XerD, partial [Sinosporangium album]
MKAPAAAPTPKGAAVVLSVPEAVEAFINDGATLHARKHRIRIAGQFTDLFGDLGGWLKAPLARRLEAPSGVRGFAVRLALATATPADAGYVAVANAGWGYRLADVDPDFAMLFSATAYRLGWGDQQIGRQWAVLAKLAAVAGRPAGQLTEPYFGQARDRLAEVVRVQRGKVPSTLTTPVHGLRATLAASGILEAPGGKQVGDRGRPGHWSHLENHAPVLVRTMRRYLAQLAISMRPGSVKLIDTTLRHLATYLADHHREVTTAMLIRRTRIEGFKAWMQARPGYRGSRTPAKTTIGMRIGHLRGFFDRIIEWGYDDVPDRTPVFAGDIPLRDRPLPRFLEDEAAVKLLTAARRLPDLFDRVCVEVLARTGLRKGEFLRLTTTAIVRIGDGEWLHVPVGKLRTDRYIPLHPRVKTLLGQWLEHRADQPGRLMFTELGRLIPQTRVDSAVRRAATAAELGHVTPHQLRHTLATQAINRGMSLEAIAVLLGHRSMSMTMTYARISDRTVAEEYFAVTKQVEALYDCAPALPADAAGPNMQRLQLETSRRLLGNGYCTRPAEIGCRYETICETCT